MKNSKLVLVGALSLFMIALVGSSFAQKRGEPGREITERRMQMHGDTMERIPDLTDEQRTKLKAFRRSEEHTSELQSHSDLVCRLLLEKKKTAPV